MTTHVAAPEFDVTKIITNGRADDKAKATSEPVQESTRTTWRMNVRTRPVGTPKDIVHVQIRTVGERRNLLGKVANSIALWSDLPGAFNLPLSLSFAGELKQIAGQKTRIWEMELRTDLGEYPALLMLILDYPRATELLADLASYFRANRTDPFEVTFAGKLTLAKDED